MNMAGIIWLAIVLYIVIRCVNATKKKNGQARPNVPRQQARTPQHNNGQMNRGKAAQNTVTWSNSQQTGRNIPQQQAGRATGQRVMTQQRAPQKQVKSTQENQILEKAKANASQQFADDTLETRGSADLNRIPLGDEIMKDKAKARHIHSEHEVQHDVELRNQQGVDDFDTYHLMDEVNDLIVKGYSGNLEFERDFVSEATDMLNRMYG